MYAIEIAETGGPDVLTYVERPRPAPGRGENRTPSKTLRHNTISRAAEPGARRC
jgi:NADPH:quinone reductase